MLLLLLMIAAVRLLREGVGMTRRACWARWPSTSRWRSILLVALFPFWWMLVTSLKRPVDIFSRRRAVPAATPTTANYSRLFDTYHFGSFL